MTVRTQKFEVAVNVVVRVTVDVFHRDGNGLTHPLRQATILATMSSCFQQILPPSTWRCVCFNSIPSMTFEVKVKSTSIRELKLALWTLLHERPTGFEPVTSDLGSRHSTSELRSHSLSPSSMRPGLPVFSTQGWGWLLAERATGFEPVTSCLEGRCSTIELRPRCL